MTALAMVETMKSLWNHVVPLIDRKRSAGITGGRKKKPAVVAAMHWPESLYAVGNGAFPQRFRGMLAACGHPKVNPSVRLKPG
jgi:hypothetical protein